MLLLELIVLRDGNVSVLAHLGPTFYINGPILLRKWPQKGDDPGRNKAVAQGAAKEGLVILKLVAPLVHFAGKAHEQDLCSFDLDVPSLNRAAESLFLQQHFFQVPLKD